MLHSLTPPLTLSLFFSFFCCCCALLSLCSSFRLCLASPLSLLPHHELYYKLSHSRILTKTHEHTHKHMHEHTHELALTLSNILSHRTSTTLSNPPSCVPGRFLELPSSDRNRAVLCCVRSERTVVDAALGFSFSVVFVVFARSVVDCPNYRVWYPELVGGIEAALVGRAKRSRARGVSVCVLCCARVFVARNMPGASTEQKLAAAAEMQLGGGAPKARNNDKKKKKPKKYWLSAWNDPMAGLSCYSACIRFADLEGDGNYSLLCATLDKKLKIFRDMSTFFDSVLLGTPVAMVPLYTDAENLDKPSIAIAAGPYVFIYRHLRPYFKFTVPPVDVNVTELAIWTALGAGKTDVGSAVTSLTELRDKGVEVTTRTLELLSYDDQAEQTMFADRVKTEALTQTTVITCMEKISTNSSEEISVSRLVIGTESRQLMIVDSTDCSIVMNTMMPDVPVFIAALGLMDTDYRILVCGMLHA